MFIIEGKSVLFLSDLKDLEDDLVCDFSSFIVGCKEGNFVVGYGGLFIGNREEVKILLLLVKVMCF